MKKVISGMLAMVLVLTFLVSSQVALADSDTKTAPSKYLKEVDISVSDWYSTRTLREYFVLLTLLEGFDCWTVGEYDSVVEAVAYDEVYLALDDDTLEVLFFGEDQMLIFLYFEGDSDVYWSTIAAEDCYLSADVYMEYFDENGVFSSYRKIDCESIVEQMEELADDDDAKVS